MVELYWGEHIELFLHFRSFFCIENKENPFCPLVMTDMVSNMFAEIYRILNKLQPPPPNTTRHFFPLAKKLHFLMLIQTIFLVIRIRIHKI